MPRRASLVVLGVGVMVVAFAAARPATQNQTYTLYMAEGRIAVPFRTNGNVDTVSLEQLATLFGFTVTEDPVVNGLTITPKAAGGQTVLVIPGQSFASIGPGRIVSLPAAVQRDRGSWQVPVEFIRQVLGPALNLPVDVRRASRLILTGDARLPQVTAKFDRSAAGARVTFDIQPSTPHRVTRDGRQIAVRFEALAVDLAPVIGLSTDFATAIRVDRTAVIIDLGPSATSFRADDPDPTRLVIDLSSTAAVAAAPARIQAPEPAPSLDAPAAGGLRTIVVDPGHGGDDEGVIGQGGTKEKDLVLRMAQRLKSTIEGRYGLRVLLTREGDDTVPADRRAAMANNNKADLYISLHANASVRRETRGAQVLSLNVGDYASRPEAVSSAELPVPILGGGTRAVDMVPWDLAQLPFAATSATIASLVTTHLGERQVTLYPRQTAELPLRPLVGANMPAVMIEVGFLSNAQDEAALGTVDTSGAIIDAIADTIADIRRGLSAADANSR